MLRPLFPLVASLLVGTAAFTQDPDPFLWLEEVEGPKAISWVREQNARSTQELEAVAEYRPIYDRILKILDSKDRIPFFSFEGDHIFNFWQDASHQRGIWRRTTLASYKTAQPQWETVLDMDALSLEENKPWAWKGANLLEPGNRYGLVTLSRGGGDAAEIREFDTQTRSFVPGGFALPEAKSLVDWYDANTLWVSTDFGPGSMTTSGYPRIVKLWKRGTPLTEARTLFEGQVTDMAVEGSTLRDISEGRTYHTVTRSIAMFKDEVFLYLDGRLVKLELPLDANIQGIFKDQMLVSLRSAWSVAGKTYAQGSLLSIELDAFLKGSRAFETLFGPSERISFGGVATTKNRLLLLTLDNVKSRLYSLVPGAGGWAKEEITLPGIGNAGLTAIDREKDLFAFTYTDFLTPTSLFLHDGKKAERLKSTPTFFDATGMKVEQKEATSKDGTKIPYFVVIPKGFKADGKAPALLSGYGGFQVPQLPRYSGVNGAAWLERGGVYVLANIRGGGEFGPKWHQAARGHNRMKNFEDFIAVAEDLIARKITSKEHLGIQGGSQGGLLVAGCFAMRPDLFKAVVCGVPLADMKRYHKLLAGASWMSEYGDPDNPEDWNVIKTYSPYELLKKEAKYPKVFFWTTTRDDRVHPAHARKMVAKMKDQGHPVYYFENMEGGHGSGTTSKQQANATSLQFAYLWKMLK